jgi:RimJ/RimL family protein N-acetyltransferase
MRPCDNARVHRTERLIIELIDTDHAEGLFAALDDPRVGAFIGGPDVSTLDALRDRVEHLLAGPPVDWPEDRWLNFVMRRADDGAVIGRLEATTYPDGWAEVAWVLGPAHWSQGFATEGARWLLDHLGDDLGIGEIWAAIHPDNAASIRMVERLGFEPRPTPPERPLGSYDDIDLVFAIG